MELYGREGLPRNVVFGDGAPIEDAVAGRIEALYWELAVQFPWRDRDVLMIDNMLIAHARSPSAGERRIVVAMGEMLSQEELGA